jgi:hypothetical protein
MDFNPLKNKMSERNAANNSIKYKYKWGRGVASIHFVAMDFNPLKNKMSGRNAASH